MTLHRHKSASPRLCTLIARWSHHYFVEYVLAHRIGVMTGLVVACGILRVHLLQGGLRTQTKRRNGCAARLSRCCDLGLVCTAACTEHRARIRVSAGWTGRLPRQPGRWIISLDGLGPGRQQSDSDGAKPNIGMCGPA